MLNWGQDHWGLSVMLFMKPLLQGQAAGKALSRRALAVQKIVKPIQEALGVIYCFGAHCSLLWNLNIVFMEDDNFF